MSSLLGSCLCQALLQELCYVNNLPPFWGDRVRLQAAGIFIDPRFCQVQCGIYGFRFCLTPIRKSDERELARGRFVIPADVGLGNPAISGGVEAGEGHNEMISVQAARHGSESFPGGTPLDPLYENPALTARYHLA